MSEPTFRPLNTGDTSDDDGAVIDSFFVETNNAPERVADVAVVPTVARPVPTNRLMTGSLTVSNTWTDATMLLPADQNRKHLEIRVNGTVDVDFIRVSDESGKLNSDTGAGRVYANQAPFILDDYTGAVWVSAVGSTGSPVVSWWGVTR